MKKLLLIFILLPLITEAQIINTIAGNGIAGFSGDGGSATSAKLHSAYGVAIDRIGNVYIADWLNNRIRKVDTSGIITTIAGNGIGGYGGDGGPADSAKLYQPYGVAVDDTGNVYISDNYNLRIRKVNTSGIISTIAGTGVLGHSGDGGPATAAKLNSPIGIAVDHSGNIFVADGNNYCVRKINTLGIITTIAGIGGVTGYSGDGGPADSAKLTFVGDVAVDTIGNVYIADYTNDVIRKVNTLGIISTIIGTGSAGFSGDGGPATAAELEGPSGVIVDKTGNVYVTDFHNNRIRKIDTSGIITTIAGTGTAGFSGDGGPAIAAQLNNPSDLVIDDNGNLIIADLYNNRIRKFNTKDITTGLSKFNSSTCFLNVFPNPTYSELTVIANEIINTIAINNLVGQTVYTNKYNSKRVEMDVSILPAGVYFIKVNGTEARKFVKE